ncbi:hypothetical protein [Helicobacter suis]|uniref:Uncharacterized protein n=2 Tax=Helicobacter suis TaxID=104628 RepID=E7G3K7_9HELI|nr:hypothetical protein [Helicobacter suis]EFX42036.1 hypothetical protein HSUHS5_0530 [Helicobacter suis HS5]EFX42548.1 hypothetical protein HSUHS1_1199 [Helicobacter suis HS1]BCD45905.1 hypothetical protein NHP190020_09440 [Helicobacter suis]BCD48169.1 hypothetical protein NHP194003_13730 [Helicobacter suis]BCD49928.1 hypothetical protein NHP194004_13750 [Helicobacter suis]
MYDLWFYGFYWAISLLFAFPIFLIGFVYTYLKPPPPPSKIPTVKELLSEFDKIKDTAGYHALLENFNRYYQVLPKNTKEGDWLELIQKLAASEFLDLDSSIKFGQDIEDANPKMQKTIANTVGLALKHKKKD